MDWYSWRDTTASIPACKQVRDCGSKYSDSGSWPMYFDSEIQSLCLTIDEELFTASGWIVFMVGRGRGA